MCNSVQQYTATVEDCSGTVEECGGTVWNSLVEQWNSVERYGGNSGTVKQCGGTVWWIRGTMEQSGFSIEGGIRRLIAAYFGIYSRLLCV